MKNLLYKEFNLSAHPTVYIFLSFALMLLIPSYPYYIAFIYSCLSTFFVFLSARENNDAFFTVSLPIRKRDAVKARILFISIMQLSLILLSVPFAIIGASINPNILGNMAGIEANAAFYGSVFIMFAIFNILFFPAVYKNINKIGIPFLISGAAVALYIVAAEITIQAIPTFKIVFDSFDVSYIDDRLTVLFAGIIIYAASLFLSIKISQKRFEKAAL